MSCRYCLETGDEPVFSPCRCMGSVAFVHHSCLKKWLANKNTMHCEICKTEYITVKRPSICEISIALFRRLFCVIFCSFITGSILVDSGHGIYDDNSFRNSYISGSVIIQFLIFFYYSLTLLFKNIIWTIVPLRTKKDYAIYICLLLFTLGIGNIFRDAILIAYRDTKNIKIIPIENLPLTTFSN